MNGRFHLKFAANLSKDMGSISLERFLVPLLGGKALVIATLNH